MYLVVSLRFALKQMFLLIVLLIVPPPLSSTWPHLNSDVGLEEGEY